MDQRLLDFAEKLRQAEDNDTLRDILGAELERLGFKHFVYATSPTLPGSEDEYINIFQMDEQWMQHYLEHELFQKDIMLDHCLSSSTPLLWSNIFAALGKGMVDEKYRQALDQADDFGMRRGATIPILGRKGLAAGISIVADASMSDDEFNKQFHDLRAYTQTCVDLFHVHLDRTNLAEEFYNLAPRQKETLKWMVHGLPAKQIAEKMGITKSTVEKHQVELKRKMNVATNSQMISKAVLFGLF